MSTTIIPEGYKSALSLYDTQRAIGFVKRAFEDKLCDSLNLKRVSAPLFVDQTSGVNDDLNGVERAVTFDIKDGGLTGVVVHSLAKWKRLALWRYGFGLLEGLVTDMNAIRRDEELDNLHSVYVDQWDWELVIDKKHRTEEFLKRVVEKEVDAICDTLDAIKALFPQITVDLCRRVTFVTTQELEDLYPDLTPKQREHEYLKQHRTVFIMQIGGKLKSGRRHDGRAPDYDDWTLNGDIMFYNELLGCAFEISSMGIRVDQKMLEKQLEEAGANDRKKFYFHKLLLGNKLPLCIGGGVGQSRLCMLLLQKAHIGEVQASLWDRETMELCEKAGVILL